MKIIPIKWWNVHIQMTAICNCKWTPQYSMSFNKSYVPNYLLQTCNYTKYHAPIYIYGMLKFFQTPCAYCECFTIVSSPMYWYFMCLWLFLHTFHECFETIFKLLALTCYVEHIISLMWTATFSSYFYHQLICNYIELHAAFLDDV